MGYRWLFLACGQGHVAVVIQPIQNKTKRASVWSQSRDLSVRPIFGCCASCLHPTTSRLHLHCSSFEDARKHSLGPATRLFCGRSLKKKPSLMGFGSGLVWIAALIGDFRPHSAPTPLSADTNATDSKVPSYSGGSEDFLEARETVDRLPVGQAVVLVGILLAVACSAGSWCWLVGLTRDIKRTDTCSPQTPHAMSDLVSSTEMESAVLAGEWIVWHERIPRVACGGRQVGCANPTR